MNEITQVVYEYIADDEQAMECFDQAMGAISDGLEIEDLGGFIRDEFMNLISIDNELMPLIKRMDARIDWQAIARRLQDSVAA